MDAADIGCVRGFGSVDGSDSGQCVQVGRCGADGQLLHVLCTGGQPGLSCQCIWFLRLAKFVAGANRAAHALLFGQLLKDKRPKSPSFDDIIASTL